MKGGSVGDIRLHTASPIALESEALSLGRTTFIMRESATEPPLDTRSRHSRERRSSERTAFLYLPVYEFFLY